MNARTRFHQDNLSVVTVMTVRTILHILATYIFFHILLLIDFQIKSVIGFHLFAY